MVGNQKAYLRRVARLAILEAGNDKVPDDWRKRDRMEEEQPQNENQ